MIALKIFSLLVIVSCATSVICAYFKTSERKEFVFTNSGYEKRIKELEEKVKELE